ncbi:MAG: ASKHA domain-containing protein [Pseudomonadota bacterium]
MDNTRAKVIFQPSGQRGEVPTGISIVEASRLLGADIEVLCGAQGMCGKCRVRIEQGSFEKFGIESSLDHVSPWQEVEERFLDNSQRLDGYRLGCLALVQGDLLVYVPEGSRAGKQIVSKAARDIVIDHDPAVTLFAVTVEPPSHTDCIGDFERVASRLEVLHGLKDLTMDLAALRQLPVALRTGNWTVTVSVWMDREIIRVRPGIHTRSFGLAIDVGTTTVAGYLCDLSTMTVMATGSLMNPQCKYGEDVMSRITYHMMNDDGLERMQTDIIQGINLLIRQVVGTTHPPGNSSGINGEDFPEYLRLEPGDIEDITLGCNTAMHHILLGLNPQFMGLSPFPPVIQHSLNLRARDLGIQANPSARVFVLPNEAGFVGADNVGVLVSEEPHLKDEIQLIIDIGTNGELVLGNRDRLISSSCATGPALEGAQLTHGMRAATGAIERVAMDADTHDVDFRVIGSDTWRSQAPAGEVKARGICGSGILDLFSELYRTGVITRTGAFNKTGQKSNRYRISPETGKSEFVVAWAEETTIGKDIVITQKDIREVQLAKGALYAGCKLMMKKLGITSVDRVKIAGAFGLHVDREKALTMGLFPDCPLERIESIGNAAGDGCRAALLDRKRRVEADAIARNVEYIELTLEPDFQKEFSEAMYIPHMKDLFPNLESLKIL